MTNVKTNFSSMHSNLNCNLCEENVLQTDYHLLECQYLIRECPKLFSDTSVEYEDIFGVCKEQLQVVKMYIELFNIKTNHEEAQLEAQLDED